MISLNCVYIYRSETISVWQIRDDDKKAFSNDQFIIRLHWSRNKNKYIARKPVHDSLLLLYPKLWKCTGEKPFYEISIEHADGYSRIDDYIYESIDSSIMIIDSVKAIYNDRKRHFGIGEMFIRTFNDGESKFRMKKTGFELTGKLVIKNGRAVFISGVKTHSYSRRMFGSKKFNENEFTGNDFDNWRKNAMKKCEKTEIE